MINTVIFDLDGTLINSIEDLGDTVNQLLKKRGYPIHDIIVIVSLLVMVLLN